MRISDTLQCIGGEASAEGGIVTAGQDVHEEIRADSAPTLPMACIMPPGQDMLEQALCSQGRSDAMRFRNGWLLTLGLLVSAMVGCKHCCHTRAAVVPAPPCAGGGPNVISGAAPRYPPPFTAAPLLQAPVAPPHAGMGMGSRPLPPGQPLPQPGAPNVTEERFTQVTPPSQQGSAKLQPPRDDTVTPAAGVTGPTEIPTDIPQFNLVYDKVATGLQPFPNGYEWLQKQGYKTVLALRQPGEDDAAARQAVEKLGMKYVALEINPAKLSREQANEFSNLVRDTAAQPLFVSDRKGTLAGALWYLHFRVADQLPEAQARARAQRLGLTDPTDADPDLTELWQAIRAVLGQK
jgi:protein tyrosine phosphatase (PTP) superfamily phosphohydrolase (DUF442 family)